MGEKPLGIDEAPAQMGTMAAGAPLGGGDIPVARTAGSIITTRSNIKHGAPGAAAAGLAVKEQGVSRVDGGAARAEDVGQTAEPAAMEGEPIPGIDVKLGTNAGGMAAGVADDDDTPDGDPVDPMAAAGGINTTRSNIKHGSSATDAEKSGGGT